MTASDMGASGTEVADTDDRPSAEDDLVRSLLRRLDAEGANDLGGTMSLNLHLESQSQVLRVHKGSATRGRIRALRALRRRLSERGLTVGVPTPLFGADILRVGPYLAETEIYIDHLKPPPTPDSYLWMYDAMGRLHRHTEPPLERLPRPGVSTYGPPSSLRRWFRISARAVADDEEAARTLRWAMTLLRKLEAQWVKPTDLPSRIVHGDIRLGNVAQTADAGPAYLDFGFAANRPRIHELAYSLTWIILRPDDSGRADDFDWPFLRELVLAYESAAAVRLEEVERSALGPYAAAVPLYLAAIAGLAPDPVAHLRGEVPFLRIAQWILENPSAARV